MPITIWCKSSRKWYSPTIATATNSSNITHKMSNKNSISPTTSETKSSNNLQNMHTNSKACSINLMWAQRKNPLSPDHVAFFQIWSNRRKYSKRQEWALEKRPLLSSSRQCSASAWLNRSRRSSFGEIFWAGKRTITFWNAQRKVEKKENCHLKSSLREQAWIKIPIGCQLTCWMAIGKNYRTSLQTNSMPPEKSSTFSLEIFKDKFTQILTSKEKKPIYWSAKLPGFPSAAK